MLNVRLHRRTVALLALSLGLTMAGCSGTPARSRITFVTNEPSATQVASADMALGAGWASAATMSAPTTFLALGAGDRLGTQVRQNDYIIAMGLTPHNRDTRLADVPVETE